MAEIIGQGISVPPIPDDKLSHTSTKPVRNRVVTDAIASEYSTSETYSVGDICIHEGKVYECIVEIPTAEGWTDAHWQESNLSTLTNNLNRKLNDEITGLDTKAPVIVETVGPAAIASFDDGADSMPIKSLVAPIEPVQDLHGYDHPWPAGGMGNLFSANAKTEDSGIVYTLDADGTLTLNGTAIGNADFKISLLHTIPVASGDVLHAKFHTISGNYNHTCAVFLNTYAERGYITDQYMMTTITVEATTEINMIILRFYEGATLDNYKCKITLDKNATALDQWYPYENICPISGWTGAEVTGTGKNLIPDTATEIRSSGWYIRGGPSSTNDPDGTLVLPAGIYKVIANDVCSLITVRTSATNEITRVQSASTAEFELNKTSALRFALATENIDIKVMICTVSTMNTDYEPYTGNQISVTFPSAAVTSGTVYSGTLTINQDRTGTLVANEKMKILNGSETWHVNSANTGLYYVGPDMLDQIKEDGSIKSSMFYPTTNPGASMTNGQMKISGKAINFKTAYADVNDWKNYLSSNNVQLLYELVSPQTIQLTAEQVSGILSTLYGTNNIWADTGDVTVTAPRDTKLYIDGKLAEIQATILENIGG